MELKKLSPKAVGMFSELHKNEYMAHYTYRYRGQCLKSQGFLIASEYFYKEAEDELTHAKILEDYATMWNVELEFMPVPEPTEVETIPTIVDDAYMMEYNLLNLYKKVAMECFENGDLEHFNFLQQFITIQTNSVGEYADKINMLGLFNNSDPSWLFQMEKKLFK